MADTPTTTTETKPTPAEKAAEKPQLTVVSAINDTAVEPTRGPSFTIVSNINAARWLKALFYGDYGAGKTYLAGTAAGSRYMRDVLMVSTDLGELTLFDPEGKFDFETIDTVRVSDYKTLSRVHEYLKVHCGLRDRILRGDEGALDHMKRLQAFMMPDIPDQDRLRLYRTIILDSLTEAENQCLIQLLGAGASKIDDEVSAEGWDDYRRQRTMIHRLMRAFKNLPMNVVFTCPRHFRKSENTKREIYGPMMTGKLSAEVQGFVDVVGMLVTGQAKQQAVANTESEKGEKTDDDEIGGDFSVPRRLFIQPGPRHAAKSRFTTYKKPYFDNPDLPTITGAVGLLGAWRSDPKHLTPEELEEAKAQG